MKLIITLILTITSLLSYSQNVTIKVAGSGTGGSGSTEFVKEGYGVKIDSVGRAYTLKVDTVVIGSKAYVDAKNALKQNTLTAGINITIVGNTINAAGGGSNLNLATNYIRALNDSTLYFDSSLVVSSVIGLTDSTFRVTRGNGVINDVSIKGRASTSGSGIAVSSYGKNAGRDSTILLLSDGTRYAAKDSTGGGGSASGANKEIQFNNSGLFGATSNFKWDGQLQIIPTFSDAVGYLEGIKIIGSDADAVAISIKNTFSTTGREYKLISRGDGSFAIQGLMGTAGVDVFSFNNLNKATFSGVLEGPSSHYTLGNATGIGPAIWVGASPTNSNYAIYGDGSSNYFNSGSDMLFRVGNANKMRLFTTANLVIQNGGTLTDDGMNKLQVTGSIKEVVSEYVDNAAALTAGLPIGTHYRTGDLLKIVH